MLLSLLLISCLSSFCIVKADTFTTDEPFPLGPFNVGDMFFYQDVLHGSFVNWTVTAGSLSGTATLTNDGNTGTLTLTPDASCTVIVSMSNAFTQVGSVYQTTRTYSYISGISYTFTWIYTIPTAPSPTPTVPPTYTPPPQYFLYVNYTGQGSTYPYPGYTYYYSGSSVTIYAVPADGWAFNYWLFGDGSKQNDTTVTLTMTGNFSALAVFQEIPVEGEPTPTPTPTPTPLSTAPPEYPAILNVTPLWQYLYSGNILGLLNAIYLSAFQIEDLVVGVILLLIFAPIYIKTKNLLLCCIVWILLGGVFIVAAPMLSALAVILEILGIGGLIWKLVRPD